MRSLLILALTALPVSANPCAIDTMVVFDGSASMGGFGREARGRSRMDEAQMAMAEILPQVAPLRRIGLVTYGGGGPDACRGIDLRFGPTDNAASALMADINALEPEGMTPLTSAIERAATAIDYRREPAILVLVTDGNESCDGAPCELSAELQAEAYDLTIHVVGFKVVRDFFAWNDPNQEMFFGGEIRARCLADDSGGEYVTARTLDALTEALQATLGCPLYGMPREDGETRFGKLPLTIPMQG